VKEENASRNTHYDGAWRVEVHCRRKIRWATFAGVLTVKRAEKTYLYI
jgi:hypothetical protein